MKLILTILALSIITVSCNNTKKENGDEANPTPESTSSTSSLPDFSLSECILNAIYHLDDTEINSYDSIATQYFHEVIGFQDSAAVAMELEMNATKSILLNDTNAILPPLTLDSLKYRVTELKQELSRYDKGVIGFVFVHTYRMASDTASAIILMNMNCSKSEAIPVKTIKDVNPEDYSTKIQQIEN